MALEHLEKKYHVKHIQISGYNSHANVIVECSHINVQPLVASISVIQKQGNALKLWCIIPQPSLTIIVNELLMS